MSRNSTIRLAAVLAILVLSVQPACSQMSRQSMGDHRGGGFGFPVGGFGFPIGGFGFPFGGFGYPYGGYGYPYGGYPYGGYGMPYGGYGGYGGGYAPGYSTGGYGGYSTYYSQPTLVISTATSNGSGVRTNLFPATAVPQDSELLLAAWNEPTHDSRAAVVIVVPDAQARIWVEGAPTNQSGKIRRFVSPPLASDSLYEYTVRAQWIDVNGQQDSTQIVQVRAGNVVDVVFAGKRP